jgi:hypothetical protein
VNRIKYRRILLFIKAHTDVAWGVVDAGDDLEASWRQRAAMSWAGFALKEGPWPWVTAAWTRQQQVAVA